MGRAVRITVFGDVQGVGFRGFIKHLASIYGLKGYVRNNFDGSVEIHVEGDQKSVQSFIDSLRVAKEYEIWDIVVVEVSPREYEGFHIVP